MILDEPLLSNKRSTRIPVALIIELVLAANVLIFVAVRDGLGDIDFHITIAYPAAALCVWYVVAFYWIEKPKVRNNSTIVFCVLYGITLSLLTMTAFALITFRTFSLELTVISFIVVVIILFVDVGLGKRRNRVIKTGTLIRVVTLNLVIGLLYLIPEHDRVLFTFRKYPDFVKYYEMNYKGKSFMEVGRDFRRIYPKLERVE